MYTRWSNRWNRWRRSRFTRSSNRISSSFMVKWIFLAAFAPGLLLAQGPMPMGEVCGTRRPAHDLNLSEAQQKQIDGICKDSGKKMSDLRETWRKAESELQAAFDESPVDQRKSNDAIEHLTAARSDMFRATSQMDL